MKKALLKEEGFSTVVLGLTFINKLKKSNDEQKFIAQRSYQIWRKIMSFQRNSGRLT
jgi:hypothetical protein